MITDPAVAAELAAVLITHVTVHSDWPGRDGSQHELSGGNPAFARQPITVAAPAGNQRVSTDQPTFNIPPESVAAWISFWTALTGGNCLSISPVAGNPLRFQADPSADIIYCQAHGLTAGKQVVFYGDTPPTGLTEGVIYFARDCATNTFKVASTSGGAALDLTGVGGENCFVSPIVPESFASQAQAKLNAFTLKGR